MKNILITGPPRCGKTTLILKLIDDQSLSQKVGGFITEEVREKGKRAGFKIISYPNKEEGLLARKNYLSPFRVGKYGVLLKDLERIGCSAVKKALHSERIILVDEIGKMELFSGKFKNILLKALNSPQKMLATVMERGNDFTDKIKKRNDIKLVYLNRDNFEDVFTEIRNWLISP